MRSFMQVQFKQIAKMRNEVVEREKKLQEEWEPEGCMLIQVRKGERSLVDEGELWDNKKLRDYEWNRKAGLEGREKVRKLEGKWRSREGGN